MRYHSVWLLRDFEDFLLVSLCYQQKYQRQAISKTKGLIPTCFEMYTMSGIPSNAIVSFTKNAESIPIPTINIMSNESRLFALASIFIATSLSTPDLSSAVTILNMPKRNPITSRLIDLNADSKPITWKTIIRKAPINIETHIGI